MLLVALLYCAATFDRAEALASAKSVLLVAALVWLVEGFLRQPENVPLIDDLEELRRDVVLEGSDPHMAMRKLRILVRGSRIEDVVQPHVLGCLREIDTAIREVEAAIQDLRHLVMMLEQGSGELAEQEIGFVRMTHASHDRHVEDANAARGRARAEYERLQKTLTKVRLSDGEAQLINRVGMYVFERDSQIDRLEVVRTELGVAARAALDARLPPE